MMMMMMRLTLTVSRYMTICKNSPEGRQTCPDGDRYPWLTDTCGGNDPCNDCVL